MQNCTDLVDKQTLLFKPYIYGTPNYADQSETLGVAFTYSVLCNFAFFRKFCHYRKLKTMISINAVVDSGSVLIFLATIAYIPNPNQRLLLQTFAGVGGSKERRLFQPTTS